MIIVRADDITGYQTEPPYIRTLKVLISPDLQPVKNISIGMSILPPGCESSNHVHETGEETWYILAGQGQVVVGDEKQDVGPDTVIVVPPGLGHQLINNGTATFKVLWIYTPPGAERAVLQQQQK